jgi:hypothetical protein
LFDREESRPFVEPGGVVPGIQPPRPRPLIPHLCYSSNVISFTTEDDNNFDNAISNYPLIAIEEGGGDRNHTGIVSPFDAGWMNVYFDQLSNNSEDSDGNPAIVYGLPVIGFAMQSYLNSNAQPGLLANYAGSFDHQYNKYYDTSATPSFTGGMSINESAKGQVLLFPYYTVRNSLNTLFSVVNSSDEVKALKVRFREGKNNRVVKSFNLYLGAYDVWTSALVNAASTETGHVGEPSVKLITNDTSCTVPLIDRTEFSGLNFDAQTIEADCFGNDLYRLQ